MTDDLPTQLVTAAAEAIAELHPLTHSDRLQVRAERQEREGDARAAVVATLRTLIAEGYCNASFQEDEVGPSLPDLVAAIKQGDGKP